MVLTKQHLTTNSKSADIVQVVRDAGGLHATLGTTPYLSLFARSIQFKKPDLDDELYRKRTLGKVRCVLTLRPAGRMMTPLKGCQ